MPPGKQEECISKLEVLFDQQRNESPRVPAPKKPFPSCPREEKTIPHLPHRLHVEPLPCKDNLPALSVLPALQVARHVHPADDLLAAQFVRLADDEIHVHRLA